jgi:diadenylate cyclase
VWYQNLQMAYDFIRPVLDVGILAFLLYKGYELLQKTQAVQLLKGAGILILIYGAAFLLQLSTLQWLLTTLGPVLLVAVAIVFQPELRKLFMQLGQTNFFRVDVKPRAGRYEAVINAMEILSNEKRGALVVFPRRTNIKSQIDTGTKINGEVSSSLIVTIFEFDTPLHDGAMVIQNNKIVAAGCFLPLSEQTGIRKSFGTRHRAALGMSEATDAVVLVVSEETGAISIAHEGKLYYDLHPMEVTRKLRDFIERTSDRNVETPGEAVISASDVSKGIKKL